MGVNRWSQQFNYTYYAGVHSVFGKATIGPAGAPTLVTSQSRGILSVTRTSEGIYRFVLDSKYPALLMPQAGIVASTATPVFARVSAHDVSGATPYVDVQCINAITGVGRSVYSGVAEVQTWTCAAKASVVDGDYLYFLDNTGTAWAIALDPAGTASNTPTGALWVTVAAGKKSYLNISATGTAASVAAAVKTGLEALTGFTAKFSITDNSNGTLTVTWLDKRAQVATATPKKKDDSAPGTSITAANATEGRKGAVSIANDTIEVPAHNFPTACPVKIYGTDGVPTGLIAGTTYYVIVSDSDNIKLASSSANAIAGTAINLTGDVTADTFLDVVPTTSADTVDPAVGSEIFLALTLRATDVK